MNSDNLVSFNPPDNKGECIESNYVSCMVNGTPMYYCDTSGGYKHPGCACENATNVDCSNYGGIDLSKVRSCKDLKCPTPSPPSNNDLSTYCECRNEACGSDADCMGHPNSDNKKSAILNCCTKKKAACFSYLENDSNDINDPCNITVNYMCEEGKGCIQDPDGRGPYKTSNCDNECGPSPNKKSLGSSCNKNSECMSNRCSNNICIKSQGGGGNNGDGDKGVPVGIWIGLGVALLVLLIVIGFILKHHKKTTDMSSSMSSDMSEM